MKKKIRVLLFGTLFFSCSIISCQKFESSTVSSERNVIPSTVVTQYFDHSLAGNERDLDKLIVRTPSSYWVQCKPVANSIQKTADGVSDKQTEEKWADGYFELAKSTSKYIKTNNVKLLSISQERILGDEAVISAQTGNQFSKQNMSFYLTRENEKWRIFHVISDNSDPVRFKFAEERPVCN